MAHYERYFSRSQFGGASNPSLREVYRAKKILQSGRGIGGIFRKLIGYVMPYVISATKGVGKEIGREALSRSGDFFQNLSSGGEKSVSALLKEQGNLGLNNLGKKLKRYADENISTGQGIKRIKRRKSNVITLIDRLRDKQAARGIKKRKKRVVKRKQSKSSKVSKKKKSKKVKKSSISKAAFIKKYINA